MFVEINRVAAAAVATTLLLLATSPALAQTRQMQKTARIGCSVLPENATGALTSPKTFTVYGVPRGTACTPVPPDTRTETTPLIPTGTTCPALLSILAGSYASALGGVGGQFPGTNCFVRNNSLNCVDFFNGPGPGNVFGPAFDLCMNGVSVVDLDFSAGDVDFIDKNGLRFFGNGKSKVPVPMLGSLGAGSLTAGVLGLGLVLLRRRRSERVAG